MAVVVAVVVGGAGRIQTRPLRRTRALYVVSGKWIANANLAYLPLFTVDKSPDSSKTTSRLEGGAVTTGRSCFLFPSVGAKRDG